MNDVFRLSVKRNLDCISDNRIVAMPHFRPLLIGLWLCKKTSLFLKVFFLRESQLSDNCISQILLPLQPTLYRQQEERATGQRIVTGHLLPATRINLEPPSLSPFPQENLTVGTEEKEIKTPSWATASAFAPDPGPSELLPTQEPGQVICLGSAQEVREVEQARDGVSYAA